MNKNEKDLMQHVNPQATPLDDAELDNVAGGVSSQEAAAAKELAAADGRTQILPSATSTGKCTHSYKYKYARSKREEGYFFIYTDVKCYHPGCANTWAEIRLRDM